MLSKAHVEFSGKHVNLSDLNVNIDIRKPFLFFNVYSFACLLGFAMSTTHLYKQMICIYILCLKQNENAVFRKMCLLDFYGFQTFKGLFHPKIKIKSFTHPNAVCRYSTQ